MLANETEPLFTGVFQDLFLVVKGLFLSNVFHHQPFQYPVEVPDILARLIEEDYEGVHYLKDGTEEKFYLQTEKSVIETYARQGNIIAKRDLEKIQGISWKDYLGSDVQWDYAHQRLRWGIDIGHGHYFYYPYRPVDETDKSQPLPLLQGVYVVDVIERRFLLEFEWLKGVFNPSIQAQLASELASLVTGFVLEVKKINQKTNGRGVAIRYGFRENFQFLILKRKWTEDLIYRLETLRTELDLYQTACQNWIKYKNVQITNKPQKFGWGYIQNDVMHWTESYNCYDGILFAVETAAMQLNKNLAYRENFRKMFDEQTRIKLYDGKLIFDATPYREEASAKGDKAACRKILRVIQNSRTDDRQYKTYTPSFKMVNIVLDFLGLWPQLSDEMKEVIKQRTKAAS